MGESKDRHPFVDLATLSVTEQVGELRRIARRNQRFLASSARLAAVAKQFVSADEWIDYLAARYHRDPTRFHRSYEGHGMVHPDELAGEIGFVLSLRASRF